jgi:hypothetical protein
MDQFAIVLSLLAVFAATLVLWLAVKQARRK